MDKKNDTERGKCEMNKKRILVLLSTYNGEKYLKEQLDSILNQRTMHEVDIFVRDDGSTDGTIGMLKSYEEKYSSRFRVLYEDNIGYIKSYFELIRRAEGYDYYALSDQDDIWLDEKIDVAISMCEEKLESEPMLYGSSSFLVNDQLEKMGETQKDLRGITWNNVLIQNIFPGHTQVFNNALCSVLKKEIDCSKVYVHDFWITYMALLYGTTIFDNESHTLYRQHGTNTVGFGKNAFEWICERLKRIVNNDNKKIATQIYYFYETCQNDMDEELKQKVEDFIFSQKTVWKRISYLIRTKVYRQKKFETVLFKLLYLTGGYKLS